MNILFSWIYVLRYYFWKHNYVLMTWTSGYQILFFVYHSWHVLLINRVLLISINIRPIRNVNTLLSNNSKAVNYCHMIISYLLIRIY